MGERGGVKRPPYLCQFRRYSVSEDVSGEGDQREVATGSGRPFERLFEAC